MHRGSRFRTRKPALEVLDSGLLFGRFANTVALALIQKWVGPDDKTDMSAFYDALVRALTDAHKEGEDEGQDEASAELASTNAASTAR